ncbi:tryptophan 2,3-dioxygenase [Aplysia californica]|uniref:Tryptophan 2,3-dioxygenase n=1 Tax=Aplysia californica TaxID=6500 RepID=A0ABM1VXP2_APLCA|nr:tryptophan 2,3-dioxygenase [Aplysia californica]
MSLSPAYELWFKQILHEIDSVREMFMLPVLDETKTLLILNRLSRVVLILKLMVDQIDILETMTPLDFLEFRQKKRRIKIRLVSVQSSRVKYNQEHYAKVFSDADKVKELQASINEPSLFQLVEKWLERTPGLTVKSFQFWELYKRSVGVWLQDMILAPAQVRHPFLRFTKLLSAHDRYKVFLDLFNMSTYLIPRAYIPPLSRSLRRQLSILIHEHTPRDSSDEDLEEETAAAARAAKDGGKGGDVDGPEFGKVKFEI